MPRLLPRLAKLLLNTPRPFDQWPRVPRNLLLPRKKRTGKIRNLPTGSSIHISNRTRSFLLDEPNPVTNRNLYALDKREPPLLPHNSQRAPFQGEENPDGGRHQEDDECLKFAKDMTTEGRRWWSSPYLRMLASPLRMCLVTQRVLPRDLLIRMGAFSIPQNQKITLLPDGIEEKKYLRKYAGRGSYILCHRAMLEHFLNRGTYIRVSKGITIPPLLADHIEHVLRVRILQEVDLLAKRLPSRPRDVHAFPVLRRLTRAEWAEIQTGKCTSLSHVVAIIVVPPLNKDKNRNVQPQSCLTSERLGEEEPFIKPLRDTPPLSVFIQTNPSTSSGPDLLPPTRIPLYNSVTLLPSRLQRAALHKSLLRILSMERRVRREHHAPRVPKPSSPLPHVEDCNKASHAFAILSHEGTSQRADTVPLAIALWRLRLWNMVPS